MNLYNVFLEVEAIVFSSGVTDHVASNQIRMKQGRKKQTANGKQGSPPLLLEIAATVPPISSSLYVQS